MGASLIKMLHSSLILCAWAALVFPVMGVPKRPAGFDLIMNSATGSQLLPAQRNPPAGAFIPTYAGPPVLPYYQFYAPLPLTPAFPIERPVMNPIGNILTPHHAADGEKGAYPAIQATPDRKENSTVLLHERPSVVNASDASLPIPVHNVVNPSDNTIAKTGVTTTKTDDDDSRSSSSEDSRRGSSSDSDSDSSNASLEAPKAEIVIVPPTEDFFSKDNSSLRKKSVDESGSSPNSEPKELYSRPSKNPIRTVTNVKIIGSTPIVVHGSEDGSNLIGTSVKGSTKRTSSESNGDDKSELESSEEKPKHNIRNNKTKSKGNSQKQKRPTVRRKITDRREAVHHRNMTDPGSSESESTEWKPSHGQGRNTNFILTNHTVVPHRNMTKANSSESESREADYGQGRNRTFGSNESREVVHHRNTRDPDSSESESREWKPDFGRRRNRTFGSDESREVVHNENMTDPDLSELESTEWKPENGQERKNRNSDGDETRKVVHHRNMTDPDSSQSESRERKPTDNRGKKNQTDKWRKLLRKIAERKKKTNPESAWIKGRDKVAGTDQNQGNNKNIPPINKNELLGIKNVHTDIKTVEDTPKVVVNKTYDFPPETTVTEPSRDVSLKDLLNLNNKYSNGTAPITEILKKMRPTTNRSDTDPIEKIANRLTPPLSKVTPKVVEPKIENLLKPTINESTIIEEGKFSKPLSKRIPSSDITDTLSIENHPRTRLERLRSRDHGKRVKLQPAGKDDEEIVTKLRPTTLKRPTLMMWIIDRMKLSHLGRTTLSLLPKVWKAMVNLNAQIITNAKFAWYRLNTEPAIAGQEEKQMDEILGNIFFPIEL